MVVGSTALVTPAGRQSCCSCSSAVVRIFLSSTTGYTTSSGTYDGTNYYS